MLFRSLLTCITSKLVRPLGAKVVNDIKMENHIKLNEVNLMQAADGGKWRLIALADTL